MPRISFFYGIAIHMYWDEAHHARPRFHARYGSHTASVAVDGDVIAGSLPSRALALVVEWTRLHQRELLENWERARLGQPLEAVDPLA
jgi:hypothetical protein